MAAPASSPPRRPAVGDLVRIVRPRQWTKNLLVLAAPVLSGQLTEPDTLRSAAVAFVVFSVTASGIYCVNDAHDAPQDRLHPLKRLRPVAAGRMSPRTAHIFGTVLVLLGLLGGLAWGRPLFLVVATYAAISLAYCFWLKSEPVIDIAVIASGFLLRAIAGGAAAGIELSQWFLLASSFGSLYMAAGKRYAEIRVADQPESFRPALARYTADYLRFVWTLSAGVLIMTYGLWAFELKAQHDTVWPVISMAPFVLAVLRYAVDVDAGLAGEPEEIALRDRVLQGLAIAWTICIVLAVYP